MQVKILPIADKVREYAEKIRAELLQLGVRVELDNRNEKIGYKIREAQLEKIPYMVIIGEKEASGGNIAVRSRSQGDLGVQNIEDFKQMILQQISTKFSEQDTVC